MPCPRPTRAAPQSSGEGTKPRMSLPGRRRPRCRPPAARCGAHLRPDPIPDCLHRPSSVRKTLSAFIARGTPAYGVVCRIVSSISLKGHVDRPQRLDVRGHLRLAPAEGCQACDDDQFAVAGARCRAGVHLAERPVHQPIGHRAAHPLEKRVSAGVIAQLRQPGETALVALVRRSCRSLLDLPATDRILYPIVSRRPCSRGGRRRPDVGPP